MCFQSTLPSASKSQAPLDVDVLVFDRLAHDIALVAVFRDQAFDLAGEDEQRCFGIRDKWRQAHVT